MEKGLSDLLVQGAFGMSTIDLDRAEQMPLEKFRKKYIEEMENYFVNSSKQTIQCQTCTEQITSADDLIRYYGANLHVECFKKEYAIEREKNRDKRYFDLVLKSLDSDAPTRI